MKLYKLITCCLLLSGAMHLAVAQMPGTPYLTGKKLPCTTPTISLVSGTGTITTADAATFTVTANNYTTITWTIKNSSGVTVASNIGLSTGPQTFSTADTYTVVFTAINTGNCGTTTTYSAPGTEIVTSAPCVTPTLTAVTGTGSIAPGGTATFKTTGTNVSNATWAISPTTGVSTTSGTGLSTGAITFATAGTYMVTFTAYSNSGSCTQTQTSVNGTEIVALAPCPTPVLGAISPLGSINPGSSVTFTITSTPSTYISLTWIIKRSDSTVFSSGIGATTGPQTFTAEDHYKVTFIAINNTGSCGASQKIVFGTETVATQNVAIASAASTTLKTIIGEHALNGGGSFAWHPAGDGTGECSYNAANNTISFAYASSSGGSAPNFSDGIMGMTLTATPGNLSPNGGIINFHVSGTTPVCPVGQYGGYSGGGPSSPGGVGCGISFNFRYLGLNFSVPLHWDSNAHCQ